MITSRDLDLLNDRQIQILNLIIQGKTVLQIARILNVSDKTVYYYRNQMFSKLKILTRTHSELIHVWNISLEENKKTTCE